MDCFGVHVLAGSGPTNGQNLAFKALIIDALHDESSECHLDRGVSDKAHPIIDISAIFGCAQSSASVIWPVQ